MTLRNDPQPDSFADPSSEPISLHHFLKVIRAYRVAIVTSLTGVAIAIAIAMLAAYLFAPAQRVTTQPFRLDFAGAATGRFPNNLRFSTTEIVSPSILLQVYKRNELQRYATFPSFSRSIFVLESNHAYEVLAADYQARLADPRISTVDRERLLREYEQKRDAIAKNEYALSFVAFEGLQKIPESIVRKALSETLSTWADYAVKDQDVLAFQFAVLTPEVLQPSPIEQSSPVIATTMLRARALRLHDNIVGLRKLPGADLARAGSQHLSLEEVRMRIEETVRYQIDPLVSRALASSAASPAIGFLQDQLNYDRRVLTIARGRADSLRQALAAYEQPIAVTGSSVASPGGQGGREAAAQTVMPQLSDTFVDRMVELVGRSADAQYRQDIVSEYEKALQAVVPLEQAVDYDSRLLDEAKRSTATRSDPTIPAEVESVRAELRFLVVQMNEIYREISRSIYSNGQLITITAPPSTHVERAISLTKLLLWSIMAMLIAIPVVIAGCLLHARAHEEEILETQKLQDGHLEHAT